MWLEVLGKANNNFTKSQLVSVIVDARIKAINAKSINAKAISNTIYLQLIYLPLQDKLLRETCYRCHSNQGISLNPVYTLGTSLYRLLYRAPKRRKTVEDHSQLIIMFGKRVG